MGFNAGPRDPGMSLMDIKGADDITIPANVSSKDASGLWLGGIHQVGSIELDWKFTNHPNTGVKRKAAQR